ncbi:hypothetical protein PR048_028826 [Dryococelus australis]|uniref:Uncharacterized protein n=1 Tax=Dryococelus australis TaxID=614101 RepID=A0ABQ9GEB4_9NEOP|nr:hypothetical protein PR048_028826 [Dryococelus australis]
MPVERNLMMSIEEGNERDILTTKARYKDGIIEEKNIFQEGERGEVLTRNNRDLTVNARRSVSKLGHIENLATSLSIGIVSPPTHKRGKHNKNPVKYSTSDIDNLNHATYNTRKSVMRRENTQCLMTNSAGYLQKSIIFSLKIQRLIPVKQELHHQMAKAGQDAIKTTTKQAERLGIYVMTFNLQHALPTCFTKRTCSAII